MTEHASAGTTGLPPIDASASDDGSLRTMTVVLVASIATIGANSLALGPIAPAVAQALGGDEVTVMRAAAGYGLGTALGALALSPLVDRLGAHRALLVALFAVARTRRTGASAQGTSRAGTRDAATVWPHRTLGIPGVLPLLLICFGFMAAFYGMYSYVGAHVHGTLGRPVRASAWVTLSYGAGFGLAAFGDGLIDRFGAARALAPTFATVVIVYVGFALGAPSFGAVIALAFAWGAINHIGLNLIVAGLSAIDPVRRGAILGAYSATTYLSGALGTLAFGRVYAAAGFASVAWAAAAVVAVMATAGRVAARGPARDRDA